MEGKDQGIPQLVEWRAIDKLLEVVTTHIAPTFADGVKVNLVRPGFTTTFTKVCADFLTWYQRYGPALKTAKTRHGIFLVGHEREDKDRDNDGKTGGTSTFLGKDSKGRYTHCICGSDEHRVSGCRYVMPFKRPPNWKGEIKIQERVDKFLADDVRPGLSKFVKKVINEHEKSNKPNSG